MKMPSMKQTLLGLMCAGVLGYACNRSERQLQAQPTANPGTTTPGTVQPNTEDPNRNPMPGTPTNPSNPTDPTAPANPSAPTGTTAQPPERAPSPRATDTDMNAKPLAAADMTEAKATIKKLREVNATEIAAGKLAQENASSDDVKDFGRQLVEDHQNADKKLVDFANKHNVMLTTGTTSEKSTTAAGSATMGDHVEPMPLDAEGKKTLAKLHGLTGAKFDKQFASTMVQGHQKALALIKSAKVKVKDDEFTSVLSDIQSAVENHLDHAKKLASGHGNARSAAPSEEQQPPTRQGRRPASTPVPRSEPSTPGTMPGTSPINPLPPPTP